MLNERQLAQFLTIHLLGHPFQIGGDGPETFDCYGVVRAVMLNGFDIEMPTISRADVSPHVFARRLMASEVQKEWIDFGSNRGQNGDVMVMGNVDGRDYHLGVRLQFGPQHVVVHAEEDLGVVVEEVATLVYRGYHRVRYRRHLLLMNERAYA